MDVKLVEIGKLTPYARNPRKIPADAVAVVRESIEKFGWVQPIVAWEGQIVAGHTRLAAALDMGLKRVPVFDASHLTETEARALRLTDNRSHEMTGWDIDVLAQEVSDMEADAIPGFSADEISVLTEAVGTDAEDAAETDTAPQAGDDIADTVLVTTEVPRDRVKAFRAMVAEWLSDGA